MCFDCLLWHMNQLTSYKPISRIDNTCSNCPNYFLIKTKVTIYQINKNVQNQAYCLYSIFEDEADLQGVVIRVSRQVSVESHPGHLSTRLDVGMSPVQSVVNCTWRRAFYVS